MSIKSFFLKAMKPPPEEASDDQRNELRLAACALLLELAHADEEFSEEERRHLVGAVRRQYGLDHTEAQELLNRAEQQRASATDLWQFTRLIKDNYSLGQKMVLAEIMWGLLYADGSLAGREEALMRRVSGLLDLEPAYLSEARKRFQKDLESGID